MKCTIPEISWHNRDPVLSVDIQPNSSNGMYRLATAGTDHHVIIWQLIILDNGGVSVESLCDLGMHNRAVNAVRFSPDGNFLASSDDEAALIIWKKVSHEASAMDIFADDSGKENKEHWTVFKMLRGHIEDIYDLSWSSCSSYLISGSVDNTAILWDVAKGKNIGLLNEHNGFVQGVSWDPLGQYVATLSSDRYMRVYHINNKKVLCSVKKATLPKQYRSTTTDGEDDKLTNLFYDDSLKSFCRRLSFSPDGEVIVAPTGMMENRSGGGVKHINGTHLFSRHAPQKPAIFLPTNDKYTIAARFCPLKFELNPIIKEKENTETCDNMKEPWQEYSNMFQLPYRMIFAVATQNYVLFYDTQQPLPFAKISNIHYTRLSDISWSSDGLILVISSTDGYCSLVSFSEGELGTIYNGNTPSSSTVTSPVKQSDITATKTIVKSSPKSEKLVSAQNSSDPDEKMDIDEESGPPTILADSIESTSVKENNSSSANKFDGEKMDEDEAAKPIAKVIQAKPIEIRRKPNGKTGKRVSLVTLSKPSHKNDAPISENIAASTSNKENKDSVIEDISDKKPSTLTASTANNEQSPSKSAIKTPRRVSLVTLSSPKNKKSIKEGKL